MKKIASLIFLVVVMVTTVISARAEQTMTEPLPDEYEIKLITYDISGEAAGIISWPSLSDDGKYLAFGAPDDVLDNTDGGTSDAFVKNLETSETVRASVSSTGEQANFYPYRLSISGNGKFVVFDSDATNLVADDTNNNSDIFVHDIVTHETTRVSVASDGSQTTPSNLETYYSSAESDISYNGRFVTFTTNAFNLVADDTNNNSDIFVHDIVTHETTRVSVASDGSQGNGASFMPAISSDGRYVSFVSAAPNLVPNDNANNTNLLGDLFLHDRQTGETKMVSVTPSGEQGDSFTYFSYIRDEGRSIFFLSDAGNFSPGDTNENNDLFRKDMVTGEIEILSLSPEGQYYLGTFNPAISADGKYATFSVVTKIESTPEAHIVEYDALIKNLETGEVKSFLPDDIDPKYAMLEKAVSDKGDIYFLTSYPFSSDDHNDYVEAFDIYLATEKTIFNVFLPLVIK